MEAIDTALIALIVLCGIGVLFCLFMLHRNRRVYKFRTGLNAVVSTLSKEDINQLNQWKWRYEELDKVKYETMLHRFWLPLKPESFWDDLDFLDQTAYRGKLEIG